MFSKKYGFALVYYFAFVILFCGNQVFVNGTTNSNDDSEYTGPTTRSRSGSVDLNREVRPVIVDDNDIDDGDGEWTPVVRKNNRAKKAQTTSLPKGQPAVESGTNKTRGRPRTNPPTAQHHNTASASASNAPGFVPQTYADAVRGRPSDNSGGPTPNVVRTSAPKSSTKVPLSPISIWEKEDSGIAIKKLSRPLQPDPYKQKEISKKVGCMCTLNHIIVS